MIKTFSINEEMKGLIPITNRGEHTSEDTVKAAFSSLGNGDFRDASVYLGSFDGNAGWERHLRGEELVHVIAGSAEFDIIVNDERQILQLSSGSLLVVPTACWHRFRSENGITVLTVTPKSHEPHFFVDDPRQM